MERTPNDYQPRPSSRPDILRAAALGLLVLWSSACSSSSGASDPNAAPPGCQQTMCDLTIAVCLQHCISACDFCAQGAAATSGGGDPSLALAICEDNGCAGESPTCPEPCAFPDALDSCRQTPENAICIDHVGDPVPPGSPPCNAAMSAASCAAGVSEWYMAALYALAPACQQCDDDGWGTKCGNAVCQTEQQAVYDCVLNADKYPYQHVCDDGSSCDACNQEFDADQTCLNAAFVDPSDPGGCNSGSHACWVQPVCQPIY